MTCSSCKELKEENKKLLDILRDNNQQALKRNKKRETMQGKIKVINKAVELGFVERRNYMGVALLVDGAEDQTDAWETLEDWVNEQRKITVKISGKDLVKAVEKSG